MKTNSCNNNILGFFILFLAIAFLIFSFSSSDDVRTLSISAQASDEFEAEVFSVNLGAQITGSSADEVQRELSTIMSNLRSSLSGMDVEIKSTSFHVSPIMNYRDNYEITSYSGYMNFYVESNNLDLAGQVIDIAGNVGANNINNLRFDLSEDSKKEYRDVLVQRAISDATNQAKVAAAASNSKIGKVVEINMNQNVYYPFLRSSEASMDAGFSDAIVPGTVSLSTSLDLVFELR